MPAKESPRGSTDTRPTRRAFLGLLGGAALLGALGRFLIPRRRTASRVLSVPRRDLPARGALVYRESRLALIRTGDAVTALSLVCTHLGCTVSVTPTELVCPCHGSRFDLAGGVLAGPAPKPLRPLRVVDRGEFLEVYPEEVSHG